MEFGFQFRIGVPASVAGVAIGIFFAIFEVQEWKVPTPLAVFFLAVVSAIIVVALGMVVYELRREVLRFLEHRATSPSWVSPEEPGLLDYEADGLRAMGRFTREINGLTKDTQKFGQTLKKHTARLKEAGLSGKPKLKQRRANQSAKAIDRSAGYIEKRADLLKALVKDIHRNFAGLIAIASISTEKDREASRSLLATLTASGETVSTTIDQMAGYRDSVREVEGKNLSRTVRKASKRLGDALEDTVRFLRKHKENSRQLHRELARRLDGSS